MLYQKLKDESGMAMLVVLIVAFLSTILVSSFMGIVMSESDHSMWQKRRSQVLFIAEAGIEQALYYLNNIDDSENPWVDGGQLIPTPPPLECHGDLAEGYYDVTVYSQNDEPWLPENAYLIVSTGTIPRTGADDVTRTITCIADKLDEIPVHAALSILDDTDAPDELIQFESTEWTIDGTDMDDTENHTGLPGIAIANEGDNIVGQLGGRIDQVTGADENGVGYVGEDAILQDPSLPKNLDAYANYFRRVALDVSGMGSIPKELLGTEQAPQVLYANLSEGPLRILPNQPGYGVLVLDGIGDFKLDVNVEGRGEWFGIIICTRDSVINLNGGGSTASHIYGALMVANGNVTMNGTADIVYSSKYVNNINFKLLLFQVYSWCDGWGTPLGSEYDPVTTEGYTPPATN